MITIIVPLDFSETSFNAAHYAVDMFNDRNDVNIILYHYYASGEDVAKATNYLNTFKDGLPHSATNVETAIDSGDNFIDSLAKFGHVKGSFLIVMGLTGKSPLAQRFSGSNTLKMTEKNVCPVLIVPADAKFTSISNVLITSEMKAVEETPTLIEVKKVLDHFKPALHILNVDSSHYISLTTAFKAERDKMEELLADFKPEFYFMRLYDFHEAVNLFTQDKHIDMIHKYYSNYLLSKKDRVFVAKHSRLLRPLSGKCLLGRLLLFLNI